MANIFFWIKKDYIKSQGEWDSIEKALSHKYIDRKPNPTGKTKWYYIYASTFKKPFKALADLFGVKKDRVDTDYAKENIKKNYGVDKQTFAAHVLEYFTNSLKWNNIFGAKENREKYKKPVQQSKVVQALKEKKVSQPKDQKDTEAVRPVVNRSLMRKVWSLYSPEAKQIAQQEKDEKNRSEAMKGNQNAKKDIQGENGNERSENNIEQTGVSERNSSIRRQGGGNSGTDGGEVGNRTDGSESQLDSDELGIGLGERQTDERLRPGRGVPGRRLTKTEIKDIRTQVKELLATKKDDEFTDADKAILRQYEGAGGLGEDNASVSGTLYEYYTPQTVVNKVWQLVDKYNPKQDKKVIEPASGTGRFAEGRSEKFTMFELEKDSSRINKILHPGAKVIQGYFQENFMHNGMFTEKDFDKFDVAVGNPPYGKYEGRYKGLGEGKEHSRIEEYFIDRTLDTLKDGGILAMVVPSSFLASKDSKIKQKLERKGKLLEAWRLPNGTFETTGVGTDIIILRKEKGVSGSLSNNVYFEKNPGCIVGTETERTGRFGNVEKYIALNPGQTFDEAIETIKTDAIPVDKQNIPETVTTITEQPEWVGKVTTINRETGKTTVKDKDGKVTVTKEGKTRLEAMRGNKNAEGEHDVEQKIVGSIMDATQFNEKYGKNLSKEELDIWKVSDVDGNVNMNALSEDLQSYVQKSGNYVSDKGKWEHVANYASGNVVQKLEELEKEYEDKNNKEYLYKKELLEKVMPQQKKIDQLDLSPLENWTRDYTVNVEGQKLSLIDAFYLWAYNGQGYYHASDSPITPYEIPAQISWNDVREYIDKVPVKAERMSKDASKEDRDYAQKKAQKTRDLRRQTAEKLFNRFLKDGLNKANADELCDNWNRQFNSHVNPDYKKIPVFVDGMCTHKGSKEFTLLEQQVKGISFLANKGSGILAYDVGVGKTAAGIVATVNQIQTDRSKRPLICVPKAVYKKWIKEIHEHFPNQAVFELGNLSKQYFKDGDTIPEGSITVCTYEALKKMTFKEEALAEISEDAEYNAINPYNSNKKKTARDKANDKNKVETLVGEMSKTTGKDTFYFEDLGFDHITVDEVHNFKNIFSLPRNYKLGKDDEDEEEESKEANEFSKIRGSSSDRGKKMFAITQYIQRHNGNRNVYALSATPFTNSPTEIYSMLSLVERHRLIELGIYSLHEFLAKFAELRTEYVVQPDNTVKEEQVVKSFRKLQALQNLISEYIDKVDGDEAKVIRPHKVTHTPELELSDLQKEMIQKQIDYMQNAPKDDTAATIVAMNNMRMITLAPAIVDSSLLDQFVESSPKLKFVCDSIIGQWKTNKNNSQIIYMPRGVEHFDKVVDYLVKNGMPKDAIATLSGGASNEKELDKRESIIKDFNDENGKCKVIIGSGTIQEGVSLNGNATTIYNCMLGWNPSETQQVEGRIWRQGNHQGVTHIVYPLMNDSIDALMYQKYDEKQSRIDALWKYKGDSLNVSDIDPEELKFGLIKDPEKRADLQIIKEKENLENDVRQLGIQIDILHKNETLAYDTEVKAECNNNQAYRTAQRNLAEDSNFIKNMEYFGKNAEAGEKLKKIVSKMKKNESLPDNILETVGLNSYSRGELSGYEGFNVKNVKANIDSFIKKNAESYKSAKQTKESYERIIRREEKRVTDLIESAKTALTRQSITTKAAVDDKIKTLANDMTTKKDELGKMSEKREEYRQRAIEDIKKNQKTLPKLEDMVKQNVDSIVSTLRPMDEVKKWIKEGRETGKTKEQIAEKINARTGVNKSWCYFQKDKGGNIRMYVKKSVIANFANSN
jgi:N12 class adenine-specific DNA methylase